MTLPSQESKNNATPPDSNLPPLAGLPPLPGEAPSVTPPTPAAAEAPLPADNGTKLVDNQLTPGEAKKSVKAKTARHKASKRVAVAKDTVPPYHRLRGTLYYRSERLPEAIYSKSYVGKNHHLPVAFYEKEYDALAFVTVSRDDMNGLRAMLNTGRSPDMVNRAGDPLLVEAVKHNAINCARLLLARHANPNAVDNSGMTALAIATQKGNYPMIRALQEMGAAPVQMSSAQ